MTEIAQPHIDRALAAVETERDVLQAERDAFQTLLRRVSAIEVDTGGPVARPGAVTAVSVPRSSGEARGLEAVRSAYRDTVMAVPHYDEEYDESLRENLAAEFGAQLAARVVDGNALTRQVRDGLLDACRQSREERKRVLQHVERERDRLVAFETRLSEIERSIIEAGAAIASASGSRELSRIDRRLATLQSRCLDLADDRQAQVQAPSQTDIPGTDFGLHEYLYGEMETPAPVLSDVAACLETIRRHRIRGLRAELAGRLESASEGGLLAQS
ncbi:DUF7260 family protein [Halapricum desulfuricans]|uniref:DUF7260 domain-containing protein n=1 Tax=Halapricum desulfuricans TaxID=2841257 RepID=A0A897MW67_9EURY|nr:hypothetical protein [Halapricum desulfuricans]QSG04717.1 Uncharacterized protein HSR121_0361 [Halapricum desulfuricans]